MKMVVWRKNDGISSESVTVEVSVPSDIVKPVLQTKNPINPDKQEANGKQTTKVCKQINRIIMEIESVDTDNQLVDATIGN